MILTAKIPKPGIADEVRLIQNEVAARSPALYIPVIFLRLAVEVIRRVSEDGGIEVNPCAALDAAVLGRSLALAAGRTTVTHQDIRAGVYAALCNNTPGADRVSLTAGIDRAYPCVTDYIQQQIPAVAVDGLARQLREPLGEGACCTAARIREIITGGAPPDDLALLAGWLAQHETLYNYRLHEVMAVYLAPYFESRVQTNSQEESPA
jgi:hypothetical protein